MFPVGGKTSHYKNKIIIIAIKTSILTVSEASPTEPLKNNTPHKHSPSTSWPQHCQVLGPVHLYNRSHPLPPRPVCSCPQIFLWLSAPLVCKVRRTHRSDNQTARIMFFRVNWQQSRRKGNTIESHRICTTQ